VKTPERILVAVSLLLLVDCSASSTPAEPKPQTAPPAARAPNATPTPAASPTRVYNAREKGLAILGQSPDEEDTTPKGLDIIVDPVTKKRLQRVKKFITYYEKNGRLFSAMIADEVGVPIVRQDETYYYIEAPDLPDAKSIKEAAAREKANEQTYVIELPAEEAEVVTPPRSKERIVLKEISAGLPTAGIWRDNFALADLDGCGKLEIVSPPPRLNGGGIRIYKFDGTRWSGGPGRFENPELLPNGYGGVAVADFDGDGRPDIVWGGHGGGLWVAINQGDLKFRIESRGLPRAMSTRGVVVGDIDGDGKPDIIAQSDESEQSVPLGKAPPGGPSYNFGFDVRAFINQGTRFAELTSGLKWACVGHNLGLLLPRGLSEKPLVATSCRYITGEYLLLTFDREGMKFENTGWDVVERFAVHPGATVGRVHGLPAAFATYIKLTPDGGSRNVTGDGVSAYILENGKWRRQRILKRIGENIGSQALAVGDLNGDGLDDLVFADNIAHKIRVFFQTKSGTFEELDDALEPTFVNEPSALRIGDVDGDGRPDIVLMTHYLTQSRTRQGGFRFFRNVLAEK
jgi:hypothetical protein